MLKAVLLSALLSGSVLNTTSQIVSHSAVYESFLPTIIKSIDKYGGQDDLSPQLIGKDQYKPYSDYINDINTTNNYYSSNTKKDQDFYYILESNTSSLETQMNFTYSLPKNTHWEVRPELSFSIKDIWGFEPYDINRYSVFLYKDTVNFMKNQGYDIQYKNSKGNKSVQKDPIIIENNSFPYFGCGPIAAISIADFFSRAQDTTNKDKNQIFFDTFIYMYENSKAFNITGDDIALLPNSFVTMMNNYFNDNNLSYKAVHTTSGVNQDNVILVNQILQQLYKGMPVTAYGANVLSGYTFENSVLYNHYFNIVGIKSFRTVVNGQTFTKDYFIINTEFGHTTNTLPSDAPSSSVEEITPRRNYLFGVNEFVYFLNNMNSGIITYEPKSTNTLNINNNTVFVGNSYNYSPLTKNFTIDNQTLTVDYLRTCNAKHYDSNNVNDGTYLTISSKRENVTNGYFEFSVQNKHIRAIELELTYWGSKEYVSYISDPVYLMYQKNNNYSNYGNISTQFYGKYIGNTPTSIIYYFPNADKVKIDANSLPSTYTSNRGRIVIHNIKVEVL